MLIFVLWGQTRGYGALWVRRNELQPILMKRLITPSEHLCISDQNIDEMFIHLSYFIETLIEYYYREGKVKPSLDKFLISFFPPLPISGLICAIYSVTQADVCGCDHIKQYEATVPCKKNQRMLNEEDEVKINTYSWSVDAKFFGQRDEGFSQHIDIHL